jgi:hypothetical protein
LELGEAMGKFQRFLDAHNDLKKQLEDMTRDNDTLRDSKAKAQKELLNSNKLLESASLSGKEHQDKMVDLLNRIKEQDEEIEAMKMYVH